MRESGRALWPTVLAAAALVCLVGTVFWPIAGFEFVDYDVRKQVLDNRHVQGLSVENVRQILTSRCITSYYPVRSLSLALDYQFWGLNPGGFKRTNALIHVANVLLVFWLVLRFFPRPAGAGGSPRVWWDVAVAAFSAGAFAVHPVVVEPVAWVGGREELLMTLGALGCIHFHLTARRLREESGRPRTALACHAGTAFSCAAACLSNAVGAVIPFVIVAWDVLTLTGRKLWKILYGTAPLWAISAATIVIKKLGTDGNPLSDKVGVFSFERLLMVLKVYWMNLRTLVRPTHLAIEYPSVTVQGWIDAQVILGGIAVVLTCALLWLVRRQMLILFGLVWFGLALGPTSQIMSHHIPRADRFLYLPLVGLAIAAAAGLRPLENALKGRITAVVIAGAGVWCVLGILSWGQVQTWRNSLSMWENCVRVAPNNALAHGGLADNLAQAGRFDEAIQHYRKAILLHPDDVDTLKNFALLLATCPRAELRDDDLALRLAGRANHLMRRPDPAVVMVLAEVHAQAGRFEKAVTSTEEAIALAEAKGDLELAVELRRRLYLYRAHEGLAPPGKE